MNKKVRIFALALILTLVLVLALAGCGKGCSHADADNDGKCDECGESLGTAPQGLTLVENGVPKFKFILSLDALSNPNVKNFANTTFKTINKALEEDAEIDYESDTNAQDIEIIIGTPTYRGDEYKVDHHYLGPEGYAVKVVGTKVLVLYGSDTAASAALDHVKTTLFGISSKTKKLTTVVASSDKLIESKQAFELQSATVCGNDINGYVLDYPTSMRTPAQSMQERLYMGAGIWLPKGSASATQKAVIFREIDNGGEGTTDKGFRVYVDESQNLVIETEFVNKLSDATFAFVADTFLKKGVKQINFASDYVYTGYDARNIYYSDFGAVGDGKTDDFEAIKACHEYANTYGHTVNGNPGAKYRIGSTSSVREAAIIKTDTNWNGCTFIFDDTDVKQPLKANQNGGIEQKGDNGYNKPIFLVESDTPEVVKKGSDCPITSLDKGVTNIGFAPGYKALIVIYNENHRQYIRTGTNADSGKVQHEIILVDANGNVDSKTPVQWDYTTVTKIEIYNANDKPIVISGGEYDEAAGIDNRAHIETKYMRGESYYTYFERNIHVNRSNVILENVTHEYTGYEEEANGGSGAPYHGITRVLYCNNVTIRGFEFMKPPIYTDKAAGEGSMGSYDLTAEGVNFLTYANCTQSNFFNADGSLYAAGPMGTNYCKNLTFDNVTIGRFDAHCGVYNVTIKDSTVNKLNFIGDGEATVTNVIAYVDSKSDHCDVINLRNDYGSTWAGNLTIDGLELRYSTAPTSKQRFGIMRATWNNHYYGYTVHYPQNIILKDVSVVKFTYGIDEYGNRWEVLDESTRNQSPIHLYYYMYSGDVSGHNADLTAPVVNGSPNENPVVPTKSVTIINEKYKDTPVIIVMPTSPTFDNMKVTIDGVEVDWKN